MLSYSDLVDCFPIMAFAKATADLSKYVSSILFVPSYCGVQILNRHLYNIYYIYFNIVKKKGFTTRLLDGEIKH